MPRGFGADTRLQNGLRDYGFGSPSNLGAGAGGDQGFGSFDLVPQGINPQPPSLDHRYYPDDGGEIVRIVGDWPSRGPYRIRLTDDGGATLHPLGLVGCYSGVIGQGASCYTDRFQRVLPFVLPPLPGPYPRAYDIWVDRGDLGGGILIRKIISGELSVYVRTQAEEIYSVRQTFPPLYKTSARSWALEDLTLPDLPTPPLETLTRALGQVAQQTGGSPQTRLRLPLVYGSAVATVESTLGFPSFGELWIGGYRYSYTARGDDFFSGLALIGGSDAREVPTKTSVTCHAAAVTNSIW